MSDSQVLEADCVIRRDDFHVRGCNLCIVGAGASAVDLTVRLVEAGADVTATVRRQHLGRAARLAAEGGEAKAPRPDVMV